MENDKIEVYIVALTNSEAYPGQFALILEDVEMKKRFPVTIGEIEATAIAIVLEKMQPARPQTHDLICNLINDTGLQLKEVLIDKVADNRFHSKLVVSTPEGTEVMIDSRTSDAIALAIRLDRPVFALKEVLEEHGFLVDNQGIPVEKRGAFINYPLKELEDLLAKVIEKEDYESASRIRNAIKQKKKEQ